MKNVLFILLIILYSFGSISAQHEEYNFIKLNKTIEKSEKILKVKYLSSKSSWDIDKKNIYTINRFLLTERISGISIDTINVTTKGGLVGREGQIVFPKMKFKKNTEYVVFLHQDSTKFKDIDVKSFQITNEKHGLFKFKNNDVLENIYYEFKTYPEFKSKIKYSKENDVNLDFSKYKKFNEISDTKHLDSSSIIIEPQIIPAGNGSTLKISNGNFGAVKGQIFFRDPDSGGAEWYELPDYQIIDWTENEINVVVPSTAGTGNIKITKPDGNTIFTPELEIPYSYITVEIDDDNLGEEILGEGVVLELIPYHVGSIVVNEFPGNHIKDGAYVFKWNNDFYNNVEAREAFIQALDVWSCETGINFIPDTSRRNKTSINYSQKDNVNVITFSNTDMSAKAYCSINFSLYSTEDNSDFFVIINELDFVFNPDLDWAYGEVPNDKHDFYSTSIHEIGHAHGFNHVINTNSIMHYASGTGENERSINDHFPIANFLMQRSTGSSIGGLLPMEYNSCYSLDIFDVKKENKIFIFPTKTKDFLHIEGGLRSIDELDIFDLRGAKINTIYNLNGSTVIDVSYLNPGLYFIKINSSESLRFIKV